MKFSLISLISWWTNVTQFSTLNGNDGINLEITWRSVLSRIIVGDRVEEGPVTQINLKENRNKTTENHLVYWHQSSLVYRIIKVVKAEISTVLTSSNNMSSALTQMQLLHQFWNRIYAQTPQNIAIAFIKILWKKKAENICVVIERLKYCVVNQ